MFTEALFTVVKMGAIQIPINTEELDQLHYIYIVEYNTVVKPSKIMTHNNMNNLSNYSERRE